MSDATRHAMQGLISKNQIMGGRDFEYDEAREWKVWISIYLLFSCFFLYKLSCVYFEIFVNWFCLFFLGFVYGFGHVM